MSRKADMENNQNKHKGGSYGFITLLLCFLLLFFSFGSVNRFVKNQTGELYVANIVAVKDTNTKKVYKYEPSYATISDKKKSILISSEVNNSSSNYLLRHSTSNTNTENDYTELVELTEDTRFFKAPTMEIVSNGKEVKGKFRPHTLVGIDIDGDNNKDFFAYVDVNGNYSIDMSSYPLTREKIEQLKKEKIAVTQVIQTKQESSKIKSNINIVDGKAIVQGTAPANSKIMVITPDNSQFESSTNDKQKFHIEIDDESSIQEGTYTVIAKDNKNNIVARSQEIVDVPTNDSKLSKIFSNLPKPSLLNFSKEKSPKYVEKTDIIETPSKDKEQPKVSKHKITPNKNTIKFEINYVDINKVQRTLVAQKTKQYNWFLTYTPKGVSINQKTGVVTLDKSAQDISVNGYDNTSNYTSVYTCSSSSACDFEPLSDNLIVEHEKLAFDGYSAFISAVLCSMVLGIVLLYYFGTSIFSVYIGLSGLFTVRLFITMARTLHDIRVSAWIPLSAAELLVIPLFFAVMIERNKSLQKKNLNLFMVILVPLLFALWYWWNTSDIEGLTNSIKYATESKLKLNWRNSYIHNVIFVALIFIATVLYGYILKFFDIIVNSKNSKVIGIALLFIITCIFSIISVQVYAVLSALMALFAYIIYKYEEKLPSSRFFSFALLAFFIIYLPLLLVNLYLEKGAVLFLVMFSIAVFIICQKTYPIKINIKIFSIIVCYALAILISVLSINTWHVKIFVLLVLSGLFGLIYWLSVGKGFNRGQPNKLLMISLQLGGVLGIVLIFLLLLLKSVVLSYTTETITKSKDNYSQFEMIEIPVIDSLISPAHIEKKLWENEHEKTVELVNELRKHSQKDFSKNMLNIRMRVYGWLVGQPYNSVLWPSTMAKIESMERVKASSIPDNDNFWFGDDKLAERYLFEEKGALSGIDYEHAIGLYYIKVNGVFGLLIILLCYCSMYVGLPKTNILVRVYVLTLTLVTTWITLQSQGVFPTLGINPPFLVSNSFLKDLFPSIVLLVIALLFFNEKGKQNESQNKEILE